MIRRLMIPACLAAIPFAAVADTTLVFHDMPENTESSVLIRDGVVRMAVDDREDGPTVSLYDSRSDKMTVIVEKERGYYEITETSMKQQIGEAKSMMDGMMAEMQRELANMPPEQRKMMEEQMRQMGMAPGAAAGQVQTPKITIRNTGRSDTVNGMRCRLYESFVDSQKSEEICVADRDAVSMPTADYATLKKMFNFMERISSIVASLGMKVAPDTLPSVDGVPVRIRSFEDGGTGTLKKVSTGSLDTALFRVPAGYRKIDPMSEGR